MNHSFYVSTVKLSVWKIEFIYNLLNRGKMIREFCIKDKEQIVKIVKQGIMIDEQDIIDYITAENIRIIVYDNGTELLGFSSFRIWGKDKNKADVDTYIVPGSRRKGIGTLLYNETMKYTAGINLKFVSARFRVDKDDATSFYKNLGYEKWYGEHDLIYSGSEQLNQIWSLYLMKINTLNNMQKDYEPAFMNRERQMIFSLIYVMS